MDEWDADITAVTTAGSTRWSACSARWTGCARGWAAVRRRPWSRRPSSGNRAFDEYRSETLRRLEDEQREFRDFLDRLRFAKDKTEFDQFMAERRNRPAAAAAAAELKSSRRLRRTAVRCPRSGRPLRLQPQRAGRGNHP